MGKRIYLYFILIFLIGSLFIFNQNVISVKASSNDLEYDFEETTFYEGDLSELNSTSFNIRNQTLFTTHYNGTFSFYGESGDPEDWSISEPSETNIDVVNNISNHNYIVELNDSSNTEICYMDNVFDSQTVESIEFWYYSDTLEDNFLWLAQGEMSGAYLAVQLKFGGNGHIYYYYGGWVDIFNSLIANYWFNFLISFSCTSDTFDFYINSILVGDDLNFRNALNYIDRIRILTDGSFEPIIYYDAIGYTWEDYNIGDNWVPYSITNESILENEYDTLAFYSNGTMYPSGLSNINGWEDIDVGSDYVNTITSLDDKGYNIAHYSNDKLGIMKYYNITNGVFNISINFNYMIFSNEGGYFNFSVYSYDETLIIQIQIILEGYDTNMYYWNGTERIFLYEIPYGYLEDYYFGNSIFNIYFNSYDAICILKYFKYGSLYNSSIFSKLAYKTGFGYIELSGIDNYGSPSQFERIENVGVFLNGTSLSSDIAWNIYDFENGSINLQEYYLYNLNATGSMSFTIYGQGGTTGYSELYYYNQSERIISLYSIGTTIIAPQIKFLFLNISDMAINYLTINGMSLTEGSNEYFIEYTSQTNNTEDNFFYVNSGRLYFSLNITDNSTLEYIQASFDISDVSSTNRSYALRSSYSGDCRAEFRVYGLGGAYNSYTLPNYPNSVNYILYQSLTIDKFTLLISDEDSETILGVSQGYITHLVLYYYPDIGFQITTLTLIDILVPLLIIIAPTMGVYAKLGKRSIIPMFFMMCVICFVGDLIPIWLFFVSMIAFVAFIFFEYRERYGR